MHEPAGKFVTAKPSKFKITEIAKEPEPAPTYRELIKEARRQFAKNRKEFKAEKHMIREDIKVLKERQERVDKELNRLQDKATKKPFEAKSDYENFLLQLRVEADLERSFMSSSSSSVSSLPRLEDNTYEELSDKKPEMNLYSVVSL